MFRYEFSSAHQTKLSTFSLNKIESRRQNSMIQRPIKKRNDCVTIMNIKHKIYTQTIELILFVQTEFFIQIMGIKLDINVITKNKCTHTYNLRCPGQYYRCIYATRVHYN